MKIKVRPEDFVVEEVTDIPLKKTGPFTVCLLRKRGWNTVDLLRKLSRAFAIPLSEFSYGGKKDRHGLTSQHITVKRQAGRGLIMDEGDYSLSPIGFSERPMGPDRIKGNRFQLTVRDLSTEELQQAHAQLGTVKDLGYPNYFDDQRFGSYDPKQGFIAEKLMRAHWNGALKVYLTHIRPEDRREEKLRKAFFSENWGNWDSCSEKAKTSFEKIAFSRLAQEPKAFIPLLQKIPREEMSLFFSAYQSHLWNELMRRIVRLLAGGALRIHQGVAGDYFFYSLIQTLDYDYLRGLSLVTPAANIHQPDAMAETLYAEVLRENDIKPSLFNMRAMRQAFFKGFPREAIIIPEELATRHSEDDLYPGKKKLFLSFFLPRGSYATMLIKRLFSRETW